MMDAEAVARLHELGAAVAADQGESVISQAVVRGELCIVVVPTNIAAFAAYLRSNSACAFTTLVDITAVDFPDRSRRFDVVYHFLSMSWNHRLRVRLRIREGETLPSITGVYPAANWFEREVFDMFGILFADHPDLRRILTDYEFQGHPLRKDFPTTGYSEVRYDEVQKRVVYEPVRLVQEYRQFDFMSPWEGARYMAEDPGQQPDDKPRVEGGG